MNDQNKSGVSTFRGVERMATMSNRQELRLTQDVLCMSQEFLHRGADGKVFSFVDNRNTVRVEAD